jgi:hypothetical protein
MPPSGPERVWVCLVCGCSSHSPGSHWHGDSWGVDPGEHPLTPYVPAADYEAVREALVRLRPLVCGIQISGGWTAADEIDRVLAGKRWGVYNPLPATDREERG